MDSQHIFYMERCLRLAAMGTGNVAPNPMVGCVIVAGGRIVGEGFHACYGGPHAEVRAIESVKDKSCLQESTIYVSLEPCSHFGKTPPCADLIIKHGIKNVVIGATDPNPKVDGGGIRKLKDAGCNVISGILKEECRRLNIRFYTYHEKKRPYILLKWAQSADGYIGHLPQEGKPYIPTRISGPAGLRLVHKWRSEEQAIMVGTRTAILDNPSLTVREWKGINPLRIVFDRKLHLPLSLNIFDGTAPVWVVTESLETPAKEILPPEKIKYIHVTPGADFWDVLLENLYRENIISVMVEGGADTISKLICRGLWDEARFFAADKCIGQGINAPKIGIMPESIVKTSYGNIFVCFNKNE